MMIVRFRCANKTIDEHDWYVGQNISSHFRYLDVIEIQADGDELDFVLNKFQNLPISKGRIVRWFGDHAKFIFANLMT